MWRWSFLIFFPTVLFTACPPASAAVPQTPPRPYNASSPPTEGLHLLDEGLRVEAPVQGPGAFLFQEGVSAYEARKFGAAEAAFRRLLAEFPSSPLAKDTRVLLAESIIGDRATVQRLREAIELYESLIRDSPGTPRSARARWRIGDLYSALQWRVEAKVAYEQALGEARTPSDTDHALLGLATNFMASGMWKEAEQCFERLKAHTEDERFLQHAVLGSADALYELGRIEKATVSYEEAFQRWPAFVKRSPQSLLRFAGALNRLNQDVKARELYTIFYNIYPQAPEAASVLIAIGDSWRRAGRGDRAGLAYEMAAIRHAGTPSELVAYMRLAELGQELTARSRSAALHLAVRALFQPPPVAVFDEARQREVFQNIVQAHADSVLGSEALFHLGEHFELIQRWPEAVRTYRVLSEREGMVADDPWPLAAQSRLPALLRPWMAAALRAHDDLAAVTLFKRHGMTAERIYAGDVLLLRIADAYRRLGFSGQAIQLYQNIIRNPSAGVMHEEALIALGRSYLDQHDHGAARRVFERYLLQYPLGRWKSDALGFLATALQEEEDWKGVVRVVRRWLRLPASSSHPARSTMLSMLANALSESGSIQEALQVYAEVERAGALVDTALVRCADLLAQSGHYDQAVARYRRVIETVPGSVHAEWARMQMAKIWRTRHRYQAARAVLQELERSASDELIRRLSSRMQADLPAAAQTQEG